MGLRVSFELDDDDLKHFRLIMREARRVTAHIPPEDIVESAEALLNSVGNRRPPGFIAERLDKLTLMMRMLSDVHWRLPQADARRVLNALAYFTEPEDLIPDHIPGLGFLDDAIMIELVVRELRHEIDAYEDFCDYRERHSGDFSEKVGREQWLENRRKELQSRMRRRRKRSQDSNSGATGPGIFQ